MKLRLSAMLLLSAALCHAQSWTSVLKDAPRRDQAFSKTMVTVLSAAGQDFAVLPRTLEASHYLDTTWNVSLLLPGASEAKLSKSDGAAILTETFSFNNGAGLDNLLQKIKASLPDDYVYNLDYDPASGTYDYTFEANPMSKAKHPGYPSYFHMTGDTEQVFLFMGRSPAWLINPK